MVPRTFFDAFHRLDHLLFLVRDDALVIYPKDVRNSRASDEIDESPNAKNVLITSAVRAYHIAAPDRPQWQWQRWRAQIAAVNRWAKKHPLEASLDPIWVRQCLPVAYPIVQVSGAWESCSPTWAKYHYLFHRIGRQSSVSETGRSTELGASRTVDALRLRIVESYLAFSEMYNQISDYADHLGPFDRLRAQFELLLALLNSRLQVDVNRWMFLENQGGDARIPREADVPAASDFTGIDRRFWRCFEYLLSRVPYYVGATPDTTGHEYARGEHESSEFVAEQYHEIFDPKDLAGLRRACVTASSAMALMYDVIESALLCLTTSGEDGDKPVICTLNVVYFETVTLLTEAFKGRCTIEQLDDAKRVDILVVDPIGNSPHAVVLDEAKFWDTVALKRPRLVIVDKTLRPHWLEHIPPTRLSNSVLIMMDSLTKYAQLGSNVTTGGAMTALISEIAPPPTVSLLEQIVERTRSWVTALGQHMDPRLASVFVPDRRTLTLRLQRAQVNARRLAAWLNNDFDSACVRHADDGQFCSTLVFVRVNVDTANYLKHEVMQERTRPDFASKPVGSRERAFALVDYLRWKRSYLAQHHGPWDEPMRYSTSFGFNQTVFLELLQKDQKSWSHFWIRIAAGMETMDNLRWVYDGWLRALLYACVPRSKASDRFSDPDDLWESIGWLPQSG